MNKEEIIKILVQTLQLIAPDTEPETLSPDEDIKETLGIDSYDFLQFVIALDEKLGIEIPEQDYGQISTLAALIDYILKKKG